MNQIKKESEENEYVRFSVLLGDFFILNVLFLFTVIFCNSWIPHYFLFATKITFVVMNFSMFIAEFFYKSIIQRRLIKYSEVFLNVSRLVGLQMVLFCFIIKLLSWEVGYFSFYMSFTVTLFILIILSRAAEHRFLSYLRSIGRNTRSVLFVGHDKSLLNLYNDFSSTISSGYRIKGYYADKEMEGAPDKLKYLGSIDDLNKKLDKWDSDPLHELNIDELYCSISHNDSEEINRIARSCDKNVVRFFYVPRAFEDYQLNLKACMLGDHLVYRNRIEPLRRPINRIIKRSFDIAVSLGVCIFLVPLTLIIGLIIKIQSPGPIFFRQGRTGIDGKTFYCYKFRSMHVNKDADKIQATKNDPRKFAFGNFIRKTNLDEFPQFFNVLKGDMSIVGPRPHMLTHTEMYGKLIDKYMVRHFCKPGITGWAQVTGYRGETKELWQMEGRIKRDIWYIENWSIWLDLKIIWMTAKSIIIPDKHAY
ncbi:undecaprenyl-phosphate glucose phosphotransferase [Segatella bryantii]|uniref:undecaprenyl-phosphate glucose phosphotransferase n=1 Tax=Segatella bryantii TaxID=77095 RepID=UPI001EDB37A9|nr:undecaprenyl-phosphate glucose phosphotransferase [Segatella bryantii]UKK74826.1 undecaprenyl-phosphate glucose phosphotransferase [Segatella bryantii]